MPVTHSHSTDPNRPAIYQIRVKGQLDGLWEDWFEGLHITRDDNGDTVLIGAPGDQAALHAWLRKVRDLGLPLLAVVRIDPEPVDRSASEL